jgi:type IV fimbrial biogenesis protein FimT
MLKQSNLQKLALSVIARFSVKQIKQKGFTLVELMVTIAVLAIILSLAVPSFQQTLASSQLTSVTNDLYTSLMQARTDATRQGVRMTVCKSNAAHDNCDTTASTNWNVGWITLADGTRTTASPSVDTGETVTYVAQATIPAIVITGNGDLAKYVSFGADGKSRDMNGGFVTGRMRVCSTSSALTDTARSRELTMNIAGRITITKGTSVASTCPAP